MTRKEPQYISVRQTDQTSTSRKDTGEDISDQDLISLGWGALHKLGERFGNFPVFFDRHTGKLLYIDFSKTNLFYCRICRTPKIVTDMSHDGAVCLNCYNQHD